MSHTLFIGQRHIRLASADSTNSWLKGYLDSHTAAPEGLVVTATDQTGGRGQAGKHWEAAPGLNLTASYLLRPTFLPPAKLFILNKAIALAVRDTVADYLPEVTIKWPNDIFSGNRKVAGILIESSVNSRIQWLVAGIGINVNQHAFSPEAPLAASILMLTGHKTDTHQVLEKLHIHLEHHYLRLRAGHDTDIDALYHQHLFRINLQTTLLINGTSCSAIIRGVDEQGRLLTEVSGEIRKYALGEVVWIF